MAAIIENLQRQDLDFVEEATGIAKLMDSYAMSQEQAAQMLGKSQSAIANKLRILRHSPQVLEALRQSNLTERHARALLKLHSEVQKLRAIKEMGRLSMSVARAEKYIEELLSGQETSMQQVNVRSFLQHLGQSLQKMQQSGIPAIFQQRETEETVELNITIPKEKTAVFMGITEQKCP